MRPYSKIVLILTVSAIAWAAPRRGASQATATQQQPTPSPQVQLQPLPLPHLYWHFLVHVNVLDKKASELSAQGGDGSWLRNDLQTRLQFSDTDFAPIRASSQRLTSELAQINQQIISLQSSKPSASQLAQMQGLFAQREDDINAEILILTQTLSPQKRAALEAFMTQFFAPRGLSPIKSATPAHQ